MHGHPNVPFNVRLIGIRYRGMIHGFFQITGALEVSRRLHRELGDWMRGAAGQAQRVAVGDEATGT